MPSIGPGASQISRLLQQKTPDSKHPDTLFSMHNLACLQQDSEGMDLDQQLVEELLSGVQTLPEGTPVRVTAEACWSRRAF